MLRWITASATGGSPVWVLPTGRIALYRCLMTLLSFSEAPVAPTAVHDVLRKHLLVDGFDMVLDLEASQGSTLVDARDGTPYLDLFTFFASNALGMNHPALTGDPAFRDELLTAALNKPSNSDVYSAPMARFVETFARVLGDPGLPHLFFVEGAPSRSRTRSRSPSTGRAAGTSRTASTPRWAPGSCTCATPSTAAAATR